MWVLRGSYAVVTRFYAVLHGFDISKGDRSKMAVTHMVPLGQVRVLYVGRLTELERSIYWYVVDVEDELLPKYHFGVYLPPVHYLDAVSTLIRRVAHVARTENL